MDEVLRGKVNVNNRLVIPAEVRKQLGIKAGDEVLMRMEEGELRVYTTAIWLAKMRAALRSEAKGTSIVDELISERRAEAAREERDAAEWLRRKERARPKRGRGRAAKRG